MRFDLTDLRLFLAVVDAGSITHGGADAGLSPPAASERLRAMEAAGGLPLLVRGRRGVTPTEAGDVLAHHARLILRQIGRMQGDLGDRAHGLRATVRLVANTAAVTEFLPQRLGFWLVANPRIDIDLKERQSADVAKAVTAGFAEIGILSDAVETGDLRLFPFAVDRLVVVVSRDHDLARLRRVGFGEALRYPLVGLAGGALQAHLEAQALHRGERMRPRIRVSGFEAVCQMAAAGVGAGILPETAARRGGRALGLARVRLTDSWATRRLAVCIRSEADLTPPARRLWAHLTASGAAR